MKNTSQEQKQERGIASQTRKEDRRELGQPNMF